MEMTSSRQVPASVETTWAALNDPAVLQACIPGCESIERVGDNEFRVAMTARVGPVSAKFNGKMIVSDIVPPISYTLSFEGQGGAAGFAKGQARVALAPDGDGTRIDYSATAQIGGKLAQIGSRLVDGAAQKVADEFFGSLVERIAPSNTATAAETAAEPGSKPEGKPTVPKTMRVQLALAAAIILAMALYWWLRPA